MPVDIKPLLRAYLLGVPAVTALVGTRIAPDVTAQGQEWPCITYHRVGRDPVRSLRGRSGLVSVQMQLDCWAYSRKAADTIASALVGPRDTPVLDDFAGMWGGVRVQKVAVDAQWDLHEKPIHADQATVYRTCLSVIIWYED